MTFRIRRSTDTHDVLRRLEGVSVEVERGIRHAWFKTARGLKDSANHEILHGRKTGRIYIVRGPSGRRRRHQSSAPGETHANLTGTLRRSIGWKVSSPLLEFGYGITQEAPEYGEWLESGTFKIAPRPSIKNAVDENIRNAENHLRIDILESINEGS